MKRVCDSLFVAATIACLLSCSGCGNTSNDRATTQSPPATGNPPSVQGFDDYSVNVQESGNLTVCQVTFNSLPPTSEIAAEVVRSTVETLVRNDGNREILGMAFNASGEALAETQYGGAVTYNPSDGQILTMDERSGLQATEGDEGAYYVRVEEGRTFEGITPVRRWYYASIVFPDEPSVTEVRAAVLKEIDKLKSRELDVTVFIYIGDKSNKITWEQVKTTNGKFMVVEYVATTGEISPNWNWD